MKATFKTVLSVVLSYLVVISVLPLSVAAAGAAETTLQGSGTASSPYRITSASDFVYAMTTYAADANVYLSLENDINISGQYQPVTDFYANLNGKFHTITADSKFATRNNGSISNLKFRNQDSNCTYSGFISNNTNTGTLSGVMVYADVGGSQGALVCYTNYGNIWNCAAIGSVQTYNGDGATAAGIAYANSGSIANCYVAATIDASGSSRYGSSSDYPITRDSYTNCVYDATLYGSGGDGYTTEEMKSSAIIALLNTDVQAEDSLWALDTNNINNGYPVLQAAYNAKIVSSKTNIVINGTESVALSCSGGGQIYYTLNGTEPTTSSTRYTGPISISNTVTIRARAYKNGLTGVVTRFDYAKISGSGVSTNPYQINSEAAFWAIAELSASASFKLTADITLTKAFTTFRTDFYGVLDGNGHTIHSMNSASYQKGLFENNRGTIKNLRLENNGREYKTNGAFAFKNYGTISNCSFSGTVTSYVDDYETAYNNTYYPIGGFVSMNYGTITDSAFSGDMVVVKGNVVGGFVGVNTANVVNCLFDGDMSISDLRFRTTNYVGGFMALRASGSLTDHCTADTSRISVYTSSYTGGYVYTFGPADSTVTDCSNTYSSVSFNANYLEWGSQTIYRQDTLNGAGYLANSQVTMGTLGDLTWRFLDGTLTIEGSGAIPDYYYNTYQNAPWYSLYSQIRTINIGANVTAIGNYTFDNAYAETLNILGDSNSPELSIGEYAFYYSQLKNINFGSGASGRHILLKKQCFTDCKQLTSVTLPLNLSFSTDRYNCAFQWCTSIQSVDVYCPVVGGFAFEGDSAITSVTLRNSVTEIKTYAFRAHSMSEVTIPANVTVIGDYAFATNTINGDCNMSLIKAPNCSAGHEYAVKNSVPFEAIDSSPHLYVEDGWNWSADHTTATLHLKCSNHDDNSPTVDAVVTIEEQTVTCTTDGTKVFTATVSYNDQTFTTTYTETTPALGHDYIDHEAKAATCTEIGWEAYQTCSRCDFSTYVEIPALGHDWVEIDRDDPTCEEEGTVYYRCSRCRRMTYEDIPALGHDFGEWRVNVEPSCTTDGEEIRVCTRDDCDMVETRAIEALGHAYQAVVTPATCTTGGYTTYTCSRCGDSYIADEVAPLGHDFGAWTTTVEASCTTDGEEQRTCSRCNEVETRVIEAFGHDYDAVVTPATCTIVGYTTHTCSRCGDSYIDNGVPPLGHAYEIELIKEPTATKTGRINVTCPHCDFEELVILPMLSADDYIISNNTATCTDAGTATYTWNDTTYGVVVLEDVATPALGHDYDAVVTPATCTEGGYTTYTCTRCHESYVADEVAALGHDYGDWTTTVQASCTTDGEEQHVCTRCSHSETRVVEAFGHDYGDWTISVAPGCTTDGEEERVCSHCHHTETRVIEALGHDFGEWTVTIEPNCSTEGEEQRVCERCHETETRMIDVLPHDFQPVVTPATCTEGGCTTYICSHCGISFVENEVPPLGHDFGEWTTTVQASCTTDGEEQRVCSRCNEVETRVIEAFGHDYDAVVTPATCTTGGYTTHTCAHCGDSYIDSEVPAFGHTYQIEMITAPTATETGSIKVTCTHGDFEEQVPLPKLSEEDYTISNNTATCTDAGSATYTWNDTTYGVFSFEVTVEAYGHDFILSPIDEDHHQLVCARCGATGGEPEAHTFVDHVCACGCVKTGSDCGDINGDNLITIDDVTLLQRYLVDLAEFTEDQLAVVDTNGDHVIDVADATHLQMFLASYLSTLG